MQLFCSGTRYSGHGVQLIFTQIRPQHKLFIILFQAKAVYCVRTTLVVFLTHFAGIKRNHFVIGNVFLAGVKPLRRVKATIAHKQKRGIILEVCVRLKFSRLHSERMQKAGA